MDARGWANSGKDYSGGGSASHTLRETARSAALALLGAASRVRPDHIAALKRPRVHFVYSHHVFADESAGYRRMIDWLSTLLKFIPYSEGCSRLEQGRIDGVYGTISFDDGLKNNLDAARMLAERGISACFFVCPGVVGATDRPTLERFGRALNAPPSEVLGWDDLAEMQRMGHEIGGHTMSHANLGAIEPAAAAEEIVRCRQELVSRLGEQAGRHFAWTYGTFGHITPQAARAVFDCGFTSCTSAMRGAHGPELKGRTRFCLRRDHVMANWPRAHVRHFLATSAKRFDEHSGDWPAGWAEIIGAR